MRPGLGATYRLQLQPALTFPDAAGRLDRLAELGIETVYLSPIAEAVPGSLHGYDGTDPTAVRAELGGDAGFAALSAACDERGLGLCIDIVPNHLSTWTGGRWWRQLLAEGPGSEMAEVFDVLWGHPGAPGAGKVTLPVLDRPLAEALAAGMVGLGERGGEPVVVAGQADLPVAGGSVRPGEDLEEVLAAQHYRLVDWHDRADRNYRRFFDIDGLVGVRVESRAVFERTHRLVAELAAGGRIAAIRVDHVDGLREPATYLRWLSALAGLPVVVEKILTGDELLRDGWPVAGTTGYEAIDDIGGALVDPDGYAALVEAGRSEGDPEVDEATVAARSLVVRSHFPGELARLSQMLGTAEEPFADLLARLPVYRTYLTPPVSPAAPEGLEGPEGPGGGSPPRAEPEDEPGPDDRRALAVAAGGSPRREQAARALLEPANRPAALGAQQLMGAVMAKGVEDTAWYRLVGPLAFCEVGGDPGRDRRDGLARLHERAAARAADGRAGLSPSSTHDTKRSGDVRARLYALSELAGPFERALGSFRSALAGSLGPGSPAGDPRCTRLAAQIGLAVLPAGGPGQAEAEGVEARVADALVKGAREAKERSSWSEPDLAYEDALRSLAAAALGGGGRLLREAFGGLVDEVARLGAVCSLSAVLLRSALPGIPDCYQGDESWQLSLVDPDNRRPVDEAALRALHGRLGAPGAPTPGASAALRRSWRDGAVKLLVTSRCLAARRLAPDAFAQDAGYQPVTAVGEAAGSVVAFVRRGGRGGVVLAVASRLAHGLPAGPDDLPTGASFGGTLLELPPGVPGRWRDVLSDRQVTGSQLAVPVSEALGELPVGLLVGGRADGAGR